VKLRNRPRHAVSVANAMRARGVTRGLGLAPGGFDTTATLLADRSYLTAMGPAMVQPSPELTALVTPSDKPDWTPGELAMPSGDGRGGMTTASDRVGAAHRGRAPQVPSTDDAPLTPSVRVNGPIEYEDPIVHATPGVPSSTSPALKLPFGWPWWVWGAIVVGGGIGVIALTRR